ncbi:MAG: cytochrome c peroxidase [Bacteroidota bacterium]|nr:cytochrome c peroxidase [Bacteroidota bacterium]
MRINNKKNRLLLFFFIAVLFTACLNRSLFSGSTVLNKIVVPKGFPEISFPDDNHFTKERWLLGKKLFYDTSLSLDSSISCSSCHKPALAFSDSIALSLGVKNLEGTQNAPTLANVAYHPYYTRLGGVSTLEKQILVPIQEHNEFNFNIIEIAKRLQVNQEYLQLSRKAYNREFDYYVITRALANFERSLISGESKYDKYKQGVVKLSEKEMKGMDLFFSKKTNCSECHSGFNFSNYMFENNGLYETYKDIGRKRLTEKEEDLEKFKVPTLRNIELTAPYMHNGSMKTLEDVVKHYNSGGKNNKQKNNLVKPLNLTTIEQQNLIAFLKTLTDKKFCTNKYFN